MEKLQAALDKARKNRNRTASRSSPSYRAGARRAAAELDGFWTALEPFVTTEADLRKRRLVTFEETAQTTPFDMLRTKMLSIMGANKWRRVAITSPQVGCGKSTTAANLAVSLGRLHNFRVIVMDLDMRRPGLRKMFQEDDGVSCFSVLAGDVDFSRGAKRLGDQTAWCLNYATVANPAGLLQSHRTTEVLAQIETIYQPDMVIFDMPPMLATDDTAAFVKNVDCALLIAESDRSTIADIDRCEKELTESTNVLGIVLNKSRLNDNNYDGYSYY